MPDCWSHEEDERLSRALLTVEDLRIVPPLTSQSPIITRVFHLEIRNASPETIYAIHDTQLSLYNFAFQGLPLQELQPEILLPSCGGLLRAPDQPEEPARIEDPIISSSGCAMLGAADGGVRRAQGGEDNPRIVGTRANVHF
jgi:hypothetical protein